MTQQTLFTIGFTRKGAQRFFELLDEAGVALLIDIRAHPDSQLAGFARGKDLPWLLRRLCDVGYLHAASLAPTRTLLSDYRKGLVDWPTYERRYLAELDPARVSQELSSVALERACLLCAEDTPGQCHRRLAAEWLQARSSSIVVRHLI